MKPFIVLLAAFALALLSIKLITGDYNVSFSARIAMALMLVFTASAHFAFTKGMVLMIPEIIPFKTQVVYFSGFIEVAAAFGLLIPALSPLTGWLLICFFVVLIPANIHAAQKHLDYQTGSFNGKGLPYLWFRIPLQLLFIVWTYLSTIV